MPSAEHAEPTAPEGLTRAEAAARLLLEGPNELDSGARHGLLNLFWNVVREPMLLLLGGAGLLYFLLGDRHEAITLLSFVLLVVAITVVQERRTEHAVEALRDLTSPRALVLRGGERVRIPGREVVRSDLVLLSEGVRVPADGVLLTATNLQIDESLLTGESVPVRKRAGREGEPARPPGGDDLPFAFSGTLVLRGHGLLRVTTTGPRTEIGRIGKTLTELEVARTPLQSEIDRLVRFIAILGLTLCALLVLVFGLTRGDWLRGVLAGLTLAMAILPQEFPLVLTVFQALGARRISQRGVLTRRMPAVEALGSATVLCTDKTGTLTQNRMRVARLVSSGARVEVGEEEHLTLPEEVHQLLEFSILASQPQPFDPMEAAFIDLGKRALKGTEHLHEEWRILHEYPLEAELLAMSHAYATGGRFLVAAKGAPEAVADLCHLDEKGLTWVQEETRKMASEGLRVLGVAKAEHVGAALPENQHDLDFVWEGLVGLRDPLREGVRDAVAECQSAGLRVVMITGDYAETASSIGRAAGLLQPERVLTGGELLELPDEELRERVKGVSIFARVVPEQKLRLVRALTAEGEVVAMTGDGVNDAPALKAAQIGIAMGGRGTDVAREAADLVLTNDDFGSIVAAVRLGRRVFDNLRKAMIYIIAVHVPIAGLSLFPVLFGWPLVLLPIHVALLELIIDPTCSIAFEAEHEEPGIMQRPPRRPDAPLFEKRLLGLAVVQGACVLLAALFAFWLGLRAGDEKVARAMAFATLLTGNVGLILVNRSWQKGAPGLLQNRALLAVIALGAVLVPLLCTAPFLRELLAFKPPEWGQLGLSVALGAVAVVWFELRKWRQRPNP